MFYCSNKIKLRKVIKSLKNTHFFVGIVYPEGIKWQNIFLLKLWGLAVGFGNWTSFRIISRARVIVLWHQHLLNHPTSSKAFEKLCKEKWCWYKLRSYSCYSRPYSQWPSFLTFLFHKYLLVCYMPGIGQYDIEQIIRVPSSYV